MQNQSWNIDFLEVIREVRFGERLDAEVCSGNPVIIPCSQNDSRIPSKIFAPVLL
jgi:hypothetical protein